MIQTTAHFTAKDVLKTEVAPALGCTEPDRTIFKIMLEKQFYDTSQPVLRRF